MVICYLIFYLNYFGFSQKNIEFRKLAEKEVSRLLVKNRAATEQRQPGNRALNERNESPF